MASYTLNLKPIDERKIALAALKQTALVVGREFTKAISDPVWNWNSGASPRDIVDTGALRASQQVTFPSSNTAEFSWGVNYAVFVHEGVTFKNGTRLPARPWTQLALSRVDVPNIYANLFKSQL